MEQKRKPDRIFIYIMSPGSIASVEQEHVSNRLLKGKKKLQVITSYLRSGARLQPCSVNDTPQSYDL